MLRHLLTLVLATVASGQVVPVATRGTNGTYEIWTAPETAGPPALVLSDVVFLPLELAGALARDRLRFDRPRPEGAGSPAPHIRLPGGGSLFRVAVGGLPQLLHVGASGQPALAAGTQGLLEALAVSDDGETALVAAGGEVRRIDLATGAAPLELTAGLPALDLVASSLRVSPTRAFFVAGGVLYRSALPAAAQAVTLGGGQTLLPELVLSGNGLAVALLTESAPASRSVRVVTAGGTPVLVTPVPGDFDAPSLAHPLGPWLALSTDASTVAWRGTVGGSTELFIKAVPEPEPLVQVTADAQFTDTLDNVGVLGFLAPAMLSFLVGESDLGLVGAGDVFVATLSAGGSLALQNVTQTSGDLLVPFLENGELEVLDAFVDPTGERLLLLVDPDAGDFALEAVLLDGSATTSTVVPPTDLLPAVAPAGESVLLFSPLPSGATSLSLLEPLASGGSVLPLAIAPPGVVLDRPVANASGTRLGLAASAGAGLEIPVLLDLDPPFITTAWSLPLALTPLLAVTPSGRLVVGLGAPGGPYLFAAFTGHLAGAKLGLPAGEGFPLSY